MTSDYEQEHKQPLEENYELILEERRRPMYREKAIMERGVEVKEGRE